MAYLPDMPFFTIQSVNLEPQTSGIPALRLLPICHFESPVPPICHPDLALARLRDLNGFVRGLFHAFIRFKGQVCTLLSGLPHT